VTAGAEAEYNVRLLHPERQRYYAAFAAASEATRARLSCRLDLPYGPAPRQRLDLFPGRAGGPVVSFIHGGFWHSHDKAEFSFVAAPLVAAGATVVVPSYSLAPETALPDIVNEQRALARWNRDQAGIHGWNPQRHYVTGHSAGAHLAASVLLTEPGIRGACLLSGLYDLAPLLQTTLAGQIGLTQPTAAACSLLPPLPPSPARALIVVGGAESAGFRAQSAGFAAAWRAAGNTGEFLTVPEANHYTVLHGLQNGTGALAEAFRALLED